jgi:hypothetical protein
MHTPRKPLWPKLVVTALLLAVLYVASAGPAEWLAEHELLPEAIYPPLEIAYVPLAWIYTHGPEPLRDAFHWYRKLWNPLAAP